MTELIITVPDIPPSNNKFIGRNNRWNYQKYKKEWAVLIRTCIKKMPKEPYRKAVVHIHYTFPNRTRRDPDNYSGKLIMDPLVQYGIIQDDNFNVVELVLSAGYEKGVKQTVVSVKEVNNAI